MNNIGLAKSRRQWNLIHERGSPEWKALINELLEYNFIIDPTMTAYIATTRRNACSNCRMA